MNILIIEDETAVRQSLQELLELNEHTVSAAADGIEGIALAQRRPDVILCDIAMPGMDGYGVINALKKIPQCRDIPFIFLTARTSREEQRLGMSHGADDYITKPFTEQELIDAIAARLRRQRPIRAHLEKLVGQHQIEINARWSHELLSPLNGIIGGLELIEAEADHIEPTRLREFLWLIRQGANRQHALSRKLILHFKLERLKSAPSAGDERAEAAKAIWAGATRAAQEQDRSADLTVRCDAGGVLLAESFLTEAVAELAENALRFSTPGERVTVTGTRHATRYSIDIVDQGPGLSAEQIAAIGPFIQFERKRREQQGLGLGLAIAASVAAVAGGQLTLKSDPDRRGLQVSLDLPVC